MNSNTQHFARQLFGTASSMGKGVGMAQPAQRAVSHIHTSPASGRAVGLPTLGGTGVTFGGNRWTAGGTEAGMSVFDLKGAAEALRNGPDLSGTKRVHPAQIAHAARIARAQQLGLTFYGFKVFPNLTPGRAFMWGTILAVYAVGAASYGVARSVGITSVADTREKMHEALAPYKAALQHTMGGARNSLELKERPKSVARLREWGAGLAQSLGAPEQLLRREGTLGAEH